MDRKELIEEFVKKVNNADELALPGLGEYIEVWQKKPYTAVHVSVRYNGAYYREYDFAKVQYPDKWDAEYGKQLAIRKACAAIAKRIMNGSSNE